MSVHAVGSDGIVVKVPLIDSKQVASVADGGMDEYSDSHLWKVRLTPKGARVNAAYSRGHVGGKVAIFCSSTEVSRPVIAAPSSGEFVFSVPRHGS